MAELEEVVALARALSAEDRERLMRELGGRPTLAQLGTLAQRPPSPHSVAWLKAEQGHAVLATDTGPADAEIPEGADAIAGMWSDMQGGRP